MGDVIHKLVKIIGYIIKFLLMTITITTKKNFF